MVFRRDGRGKIGVETPELPQAAGCSTGRKSRPLSEGWACPGTDCFRQSRRSVSDQTDVRGMFRRMPSPWQCSRGFSARPHTGSARPSQPPHMRRAFWVCLRCEQRLQAGLRSATCLQLPAHTDGCGVTHTCLTAWRLASKTRPDRFANPRLELKAPAEVRGRSRLQIHLFKCW